MSLRINRGIQNFHVISQTIAISHVNLNLAIQSQISICDCNVSSNPGFIYPHRLMYHTLKKRIEIVAGKRCQVLSDSGMAITSEKDRCVSSGLFRKLYIFSSHI